MTPRRKASGEPRAADGGADGLQPSPPLGEARLLAVDMVGETVVVTLTGGLVFEMDGRSAPERLPEIGQSVPADLIAHMGRAQARKRAARDLMAQLGRRLQPVARLRRKLLDRGHDAEAVEEVLRSMQDKGLCSDRSYAEAYCRDTLRTKPVGPRYLVARLRAHQVPSDLAREVVADILEPARERELARQAATVRWRRVRTPRDHASLAKVIRFLIGRGFTPSVAQDEARAARPVDDDGGAEA